MKIEREGRLREHLTTRSSPDSIPYKPGFYGAQIEMVASDGSLIGLAFTDLTADELTLIREKYRDGKPLKVTIE